MFCLLWPVQAFAQDQARLDASEQAGFSRLILSFPNRQNLPAYRVQLENGVLAVTFDTPITLPVPELAAVLPDTIAASRLDPDGRGLRFGLRGPVTVSRIEAAEKLFIDLLPPGWQGMAPGLPANVVADLARRVQSASLRDDLRRKAELVRTLNPQAQLRVGRNPTFVRVEFNWNVDTVADFALSEGKARLDFDWPVPIDLFALQADLPVSINDVDNQVDVEKSVVEMTLGEGVAPRYYQTSPRQFVLDFDLDPAEGVAAAIAAEEAARALGLAESPSPDVVVQGEVSLAIPDQPVVPKVSAVGNTIRIAFPFERDTASAVFRRGEALWMIFETDATIAAPEDRAMLDAIASGFAVIPSAETVMVRIDLKEERLATLGSEGRSWVLSLGDALLAPSAPLVLERRRTVDGEFEMAAMLAEAARLHDFVDPDLGEHLQVVTAYPPARGVVRGLDYVDFSLLRSIHGLVLRPRGDGLAVALEDGNAVIRAPGGLRLSPDEGSRVLDRNEPASRRVGFLDLASERQDDPAVMMQRQETLMAAAANAEGPQRDEARRQLAQFYIANRMGPEALGVLAVLEGNGASAAQRSRVALQRAVADILAHRPADALAALGAPGLADQVDMLFWRSMARQMAGDAAGARADAIGAESALSDYPGWVGVRFLLSASLAALDSNDLASAQRFAGAIDLSLLDRTQTTTYQLINGRIAEAQGRSDEALDIYGAVMAAEIPPTRAEAVYRTLDLLNRLGRLDVPKARETLAAESLMWRGDGLETAMQALLVDLNFRSGKYREGFETVRDAARHAASDRTVNALLDRAQAEFRALFLDGAAAGLPDVEALALYYDFRELTPPGSSGDEMIRKLAQRLVKVDLLAQAGDLLEYQVENRLQGAAKAQVAADLAVVRLADRKPEAALRALNQSRLAELPPDLERQRRILEARALIDAGRAELAVDLLQRMDGRDVTLLRVDGLWRAGQMVRAAELLEALYADAPLPLSQPARMNLVRAGVGYALGGDQLGLSRLRAKYADALAQSAEWSLFDFVTGTVTTSSIEFKQVARDIAAMDQLSAFLGAYRERYVESGAVTPDRPSASGSA
ncbi:hypothetical protein SAMN02983003_0546 [Devosia enhydra]|uniref:Tetratricopeptide repeat-containing protein n=1 Tax=Devosia enhydra TaxID=665118 RepID=A0A1K2HTL9_9HYPH|nr:hypothetical protein SAMN02983003_0546 [Devosia enhydra]